MGRLVMYAAIALAVGGLGWFLFFSEDEAGPAGYDPLIGFDEEAGDDGLGLVGRDGAPVTVDVDDPGGDAFIHGRVFTSDGLPLPGIRVTASPLPKWDGATAANNKRAALALFEPLRGTTAKVSAESTSGADGYFRIEGLELSRQYQVTADVAAPRLATRQSWNAQQGQSWPLRIVVSEGSALRGRLVDASGAGVRGQIQARASTQGDKPWLNSAWSSEPIATGADGRFVLDAVPKGTVTFTVHVPGVGSRSGMRVDTPHEGEVILSIDEPGGAVLEGKVIDTKGVGIAGAKLSINTGPLSDATVRTSVSRAVVTDEEGAFRATGLAPGTLNGVSAFADGYVPSGNLGAQMPLGADRVARLDITLVKGATISGRVVDASGNPVEGAEVAASRMGQGQGGWFAKLAAATSAADGTFKLENVALGSGLVQARKEGWFMPPGDHGASNPWPWMQNAIQGAPYEAEDEGQALTGKEVVLAKGTALTGTVVDEAGEPLGGVHVQANVSGQNWSPGLSNQRQLGVRSDGEGRFTFAGLEPDKTWSLTVQSPTHLTEKAVQVVLPKEGGPEEEPKLVAKLGGIVRGTVTETEVGPVAGIQVSINSGTVSNAVTDAGGNFEITGIKPGEWSVSASGLNPTPEGATKKVKVEWGKTAADVALTIPKLGTISGIVEDEEGKPLAGMSVRSVKKSTGNKNRRNRSGRRRNRNSTAYATTNASGAFMFRGVQEGEYTISAGTAQEEGVGPGATDVRLTLIPRDRVVIEGRVVDAEGRPVARGQVRVWTGPQGKRRSSTQAPIAGGYFSARIITDESAVDIEVTQAFDAAGRGLNFVTKRENDVGIGGAIELRLDEGETVSGTVRDSKGLALPGMQVRVQKKGSRNYGWYGQNQGGNGGVGRSGEDGSWVVKGLKPGDYTAELTPGGDWITPEAVPVRAGDSGVDITLTRGLTIEGKVTDPDGAPLPGANVWMTETEQSKKARGAKKGGHNWMANMRLRAQAGADGRFVIKGLPEDSYFNVSAAGNGAAQPFVTDTVNDVVSGTKTVAIRLRKGAMITGTVTGPDGEMIRGGWVHATPLDKNAGLSQANTHLNGQSNEFKLGPLLPGRYKVTVQVHGGGWAAPKPQELNAPSKGVVFVAGKAQSISGTLSGDNVKGFYVMFGAGGRMQSAVVQEDGSWKIDNCQSARGSIVAFRKGDDRYARLDDVDVSQGPFDLSLQIGEAITGTLEGWSGSGQRPNIYCQAEGRWVQGTLNDDGTFKITGLPPGKYTVQGWMRGGRIDAIKDVEAGTSGLALKLIMND